MRKPQIATLKKEDGALVCERCVIAATSLARMKGLLGRSSLAPGEGILLRPAGSIHMFFMRFSIDAIFCDSELTVIDVVRDLRPWKMAGRRRAKVVIEVAAGAAADVRSGDRLLLGTIGP
jgi:uncharacterized membrane protein (UPF0127 family)